MQNSSRGIAEDRNSPKQTESFRRVEFVVSNKSMKISRRKFKLGFPVLPQTFDVFINIHGFNISSFILNAEIGSQN